MCVGGCDEATWEGWTEGAEERAANGFSFNNLFINYFSLYIYILYIVVFD